MKKNFIANEGESMENQNDKNAKTTFHAPGKHLGTKISKIDNTDRWISTYDDGTIVTMYFGKNGEIDMNVNKPIRIERGEDGVNHVYVVKE